MTDKKEPTTTTFSPEAEANARVNALQTQISVIEKELRTYQGRISNRDPKITQKLKKENQELQARILLLEKALYGLCKELFAPKDEDAMKVQYEVLRQATVEMCKKENIDQEIWKNIVS